MTSGLSVEQLVLPEQKELAIEVACLVHEEVRKQELNAGKLKNFFKEVERDVVMTLVDGQGELLATGTLVAPFHSEVFVTDVATVPEHRGKGLGRVLMTGIENRAMQAGSEILTLTSLVRSRGFYESLGYTPKKAMSSTYFKRLV